MYRKLTMPTAIFAAVAVKKVAGDEVKPKGASTNDEANPNHFVCTPSELPVYTPLHYQNKKPVEPEPANSAPKDMIESGVRAIRVEVQSGYRACADKFDVVDHYYETAKSHTMGVIDYLNEPQNTLPRSGAIAIGGLAGFIFAARGGFIKKVLYTTIGAGAVASLCYPLEAEHYARETLYEARKSYAVAYNFIKGVKPGDEASADNIKKFPTSLEDIKFLLWDLYDEAKEVVFGKK